jgi:hypothetical protein
MRVSHASVFLGFVGEKRASAPLRKVMNILTKNGLFPSRKVEANVARGTEYIGE